jgi:hypothetical protein
MADKQREPKARKKRDPKIFVTVTFEPDLQAQVDLLIRVDEENGRMMYPRISSTDGNDFICKIDLTLLWPKYTLVAPAVRKGQRA